MNKLVMKRKAKKAADYFFTYLLLIVIAIICAGPFIWLLLSSLRTGANIYNLHFSISDFSFSNYTGVMEYMNLPKYIWNTVIITFGGIIIDVVFSSLCAYPLATMEFKGKNIIFTNDDYSGSRRHDHQLSDHYENAFTEYNVRRYSSIIHKSL